jgi:hypothetical protein
VSRAGRVLAALSAILIAAAAVWLTAMYFQGRRPQVQAPFPTQAPALDLPTAESTPEPTEVPPASTGAPPDFPLDLPGFGN